MSTENDDGGCLLVLAFAIIAIILMARTSSIDDDVQYIREAIERIETNP